MNRDVHSAELTFGVMPSATDFASALASPLGVSGHSPFLTAYVGHPKSISLKMATPPPRTFSFKFPEAPAIPSLPSKQKRTISPAPSLPLSVCSDPSGKTSTRIKPPGDIIKLEDRLYYVLQPPLETLLQS